MFRVFANGLADQGLIPGWVMPKTQKMVPDVSLFNIRYKKLGIKGKWNNLGKGVVLSPTR